MLKYSIRGENLEVTDALRDYVVSKLEKIEKYFQDHPPKLADETYFLIKQLVPEGLAKRIAAYSSTDSAQVTIDFR